MTDEPADDRDHLADLHARLQRLEDLQAITQLFVDYGEHLDAGDLDAYASLFAEDGEVRLGPIGRATGRDEIKALMAKVLAGTVGETFHVISSPRIALDGDRATSTVMWTVVARQADGLGRATMVGHHHDELVRRDGRWYLARRKGTVELPGTYPG